MYLTSKTYTLQVQTWPKRFVIVKGENVVEISFRLQELWQGQVGLKQWITSLCSKPQKLNWWVALREYQASSAFHIIKFMTSAKASRSTKLCITLPKYCKTFDSPLYYTYWLIQKQFLLLVLTINWGQLSDLYSLCILVFSHLSILYIFRKCPWCNGYPRRKWTRRHEFKSWTRLIAFHVALIPLGKVWIQLFSLQLWVNSRAD